MEASSTLFRVKQPRAFAGDDPVVVSACLDQMSACGRFATDAKRFLGGLSVRFGRGHLTLSVRSVTRPVEKVPVTRIVIVKFVNVQTDLNYARSAGFSACLV
jgi:hypothetical protein